MMAMRNISTTTTCTQDGKSDQDTSFNSHIEQEEPQPQLVDVVETHHQDDDHAAGQSSI